ncbi:hypothetical protein CTEN210_03908 [Chaetoceros tenuissimus]|uniref:Uncharacterized protein n=1 Tax=Chaetoceros tenuissimus TaxID=426638 RepID=A0AAD3H294_9STRA|nr:hypothetical protein CTEN210_03908 [Chaetoceros tenuissimus]
MFLHSLPELGQTSNYYNSMLSAYTRSSIRQGGMRMPPLCSTSRTLGLTPWILMGVAAVFIPMIVWNTQSQQYYREYGMMRQYEEYYQQQKEGNNENNDNYYIYRECSFFNIACKKNQYYYATAEERQRANEDGDVLQTYPGWFILFGGYENTEAMQKWKAENASGAQNFNSDGRSSGMKVAYAINLLLFIVLLAYGAISIRNRKNLSQLVQYLLLAFVLTFANLIMAIESLVSLNEGRFEESMYGWYGQIVVLIVYTDFGMILFCVTNVLMIYIKYTKEGVSQNNADREEMTEERYWSQFGLGSID